MYILVCLLLYVYDAFAVPAIEINVLKEINTEAKNQTNDDGDDLLKEIKELEKQKNDLYTEINKAIDESITALNKSNDTDALTGINYIKDLKKQMKEFNDTEDTADVIYNEHGKRINNLFLDVIVNSTLLDSRRKIKPKKDKKSKRSQQQRNVFNVHEKYLIDAQKELDSLLHKGMTAEQLKDRLERREKIRQQLEEWIKMKDLEREKIKMYKLQQNKHYGHQETCPRTGYSKNKNKYKKGDHPCCRKCCKKSYLGCLKK